MNAAKEKSGVPWSVTGWWWLGTWRQSGASCFRASIVPVDEMGDCMTPCTYFTSLQAFEDSHGKWVIKV